MVAGVISFLARRAVETSSKHVAALSKKTIQSLTTGTPFKFTAAETSTLRKLSKEYQKKVHIQSGKGGPKNIEFRRELGPNQYTNTAQPMLYMGNKRVPMLDIDLPIGVNSHLGIQMRHGFKNKSDFMKFFEGHLKNDPNAAYRLYDTPGGIRLWDMANRSTPLRYSRTSARMHSDPLYIGKSIQENKYWSRLSPKPGRKDDFVAKFDDLYGDGTVLPKNLGETKKFHDAIIDKINDAGSPQEVARLGGLFDLLKF